jgi:hypothetical protein
MTKGRTACNSRLASDVSCTGARFLSNLKIDSLQLHKISTEKDKIVVIDLFYIKTKRSTTLKTRIYPCLLVFFIGSR